MINPFRRWFVRPEPTRTTPRRLTVADLEPAFKDVEGRQYYHHTTQTGQSIEHYGKAHEFTMWMAAGLTGAELTYLIDLQNEVIESMMEGKQPNTAILGWVNQEIKLRRQMIIHTDLLYNFIACHYVREDEDPSVWVESVHNEKVEAFKRISKEGDTHAFFFGLRELKNLTGIIHLSPEEWSKHWNDSLRAQADLTKKAEYLKSEIASAKQRKTGTKASKQSRTVTSFNMKR